jgi:predicted SprT family Zn-dependent metalloprotease
MNPDTLADKQAILRYELKRVCRVLKEKQPPLTFVDHLKTTAGRAYSRLSVHGIAHCKVENGRIEMNNYVLDLNPIDDGVATLHHELAHIVADCYAGKAQHHNDFWKTCYAGIHEVPKETVSMYHSLRVPTSISKSRKKTGSMIL